MPANSNTYFPVFVSPNKIQSDMPEYSHVAGCIAGTDTTLILSKGHINRPVQIVLNAPVLPDGLLQSFGGRLFITTNVITALDTLVGFASAGHRPLSRHLNECMQSNPVVVMPDAVEHCRSGNDLTGPFVDPAMAGVCRNVGIPWYTGVSKYGFHIPVEITLVAFDRQQVVTATGNNVR